MNCPFDAEETAEAYVMNRLDPEAAASFQAHIESCPKCSKLTADTRAYVEAMRAAAEKLKSKRGRKPRKRS
jgi:anti-sigma factor RsiW